MNSDKIKKEEHLPKPKLTSLLIETVSNGFIVYENYHRDDMRDPRMLGVSQGRKVFNTKDQLNKFINDNLE